MSYRKIAPSDDHCKPSQVRVFFLSDASAVVDNVRTATSVCNSGVSCSCCKEIRYVQK